MAFQMEKSLIAKLHLKYAEKTWKETFQLVCRCMDRSRNYDKPCEPLVRCLKRLQEEQKVSSLADMVSRLEVIAKQKGMGSHQSPTETTCYLTADLFYVEVLLQPGGAVDDVKVAQQGEAPVSSESLLQLLRYEVTVYSCKLDIVPGDKVLNMEYIHIQKHHVDYCTFRIPRSKKFEEFSMELEGLSSLYNIPGDNEIKTKLLTSLQFLGKDLQKISHLPRALKESDPKVDMILNGNVAYPTAGKEGFPMTIQFYISPFDILQKMSDPGIAGIESFGQAAQVIVGPSDATHILQMASLIPHPPQLDSHGHPVFIPVSEVPCESLSASFLLKLEPPLLMLSSFVDKLSQITDVAIQEAGLQWALFLQLLMSNSIGGKGQEEGLDNHFLVLLPGRVRHRYVLPEDAWEAARGAVVNSIPFTHPAHVPVLLELLRHQCTINTILSSCVISHMTRPGEGIDLHYEVRPESDCSFTVTFCHPGTDTLSVLLVNVTDSRQLTCSLFAEGKDNPNLDEYVSRVLKRCMSIPLTMRALSRKLAKRTTFFEHPLPACPSIYAEREEFQTPHPPLMCCNTNSPSVSETNVPISDLAIAFSQNGSDTTGTASASTFCLMSLSTSHPVPEVNTSPPVNTYPSSAVDMYSHWLANGNQISKSI